jgi:hypothetical protein
LAKFATIIVMFERLVNEYIGEEKEASEED